ncbi:MAG TPA: SgcJ/EcaC family oxidoreductase [Terriglobales bacterium]|nr:SgcJ/EcaC family oxidoreductase [Terriglobales bacterium]
MRKPVVTSIFCIALVIGVVQAQTPGDEAQVRQLIPEFVSAWARADGPGLASFFAPDGDLIIPSGQVFSGRETIGNFYSSVFARGYKGSAGSGEIVRMRFVGAEVALGDGNWSIIGATNQAGMPAPPEHGVFTFVAVKANGRWYISALREQTSATSLQVAGQ